MSSEDKAQTPLEKAMDKERKAFHEANIASGAWMFEAQKSIEDKIAALKEKNLDVFSGNRDVVYYGKPVAVEIDIPIDDQARADEANQDETLYGIPPMNIDDALKPFRELEKMAVKKILSTDLNKALGPRIYTPEEMKRFDGEHEHEWTLHWDGQHRICPCGFQEWKLACWNNHVWQPWAPAAAFGAHPGLTKKVNDGANYVWSRAPHLVRSSGILPMEYLNEHITMVGAGSVGSFTGLALNKMGFTKMLIIDNDTCKLENLGTQLYGWDYSNGQNQPKAALLVYLLNQGIMRPTRNTNTTLTSRNEKFTRETDFPAGLVVSAVDSMASRTEIWKAVRKNKKVTWLIDARMGAEFALLYVINPNDEKDIKAFEKTLHDDQNAVQEPCTAKATVYTAFMIAGLIGKAVKDVLVGTPYPRVVHWNIAEHNQTIWKGGEKPAVKLKEKKKAKACTAMAVVARK